MPLDVDFLMGEGVEVDEGVTIASDWTEAEALEMLDCLEQHVGYPCSRKLIVSSTILGYGAEQREMYRELVLRSVPPGERCDLPTSCYVSIEALRGCIERRGVGEVA
tara:strand:- start:142 stop:462 length:321 start_codon:yes stop_codon:yes gene_type:complete